jgi:hypothetical protein
MGRTATIGIRGPLAAYKMRSEVRFYAENACVWACMWVCARVGLRVGVGLHVVYGAIFGQARTSRPTSAYSTVHPPYVVYVVLE